MTSIGLRELRQNASEYLRRVESGETIEVTNRGRIVARIVPARPPGLEQLEREGRITTSGGNFLSFPDPLKHVKGKPAPSEVLRRMREGER